MKTSNSPEPHGSGVSATFKVGAICLAFLILGYQICLFINHAAVSAIVAHRDHPDTVFVQSVDVCTTPAGSGADARSAFLQDGTKQSQYGQSGMIGDSVISCRKPSEHGTRAKQIYESSHSRKVESFPFNPNTVSADDLVRLGFSSKQAQSIINYREKGGLFRRKEDFAKSYVVADSVFERLEPYIDIPLIDINLADSAEFDSLPGIGGWFASKMVSYREELGGYSNIEQLMNIYHFDHEKFAALKDLICCRHPAPPFELWTLSAEELRKHPSIRSFKTAKSIVIYRENNKPEDWTVSGLKEAGILNEEQAYGLLNCAIADPESISRTAP